MKTILVLEDNLEIRENTAEILSLAGYEVFTAKNGREGFELVLCHHPDLVICDLEMPEWDGKQFLKQMKDKNLTEVISLVFFSAGSIPPVDWKQLALNGSKFLSKPFTGEELLNIISSNFSS